MPLNFARSKGLGKWAEKKVIEHIRSLGFTVEDVSDNEEWQNKGIDILVGRDLEEHEKLPIFSADIKMDRLLSKTGNLFIETMSGADTMGNMVTSSADFFLYLDPFGKRLYYLDRKKLFDFWHKNQLEIPIKQVRSKSRVTKGFLITVELLISLGILTRTDAIETD